jgi:hypothetical protein
MVIIAANTAAASHDAVDEFAGLIALSAMALLWLLFNSTPRRGDLPPKTRHRYQRSRQSL